MVKLVPLKGGGRATVHTGGDCCAACAADEAGFDAWYARDFPVQAASKKAAKGRKV